MQISDETKQTFMNKTIKLMILVAVVSVGFLVGTQGKSSKVEEGKSPLTLANVEALTDGENDCTNINGYRQWNTSGKLFQRESEFYDCCSKERDGYSPKENCRG